MEQTRDRLSSDPQSRLVLRSRPGLLTLLLLCAVQFLDIVDVGVVNVALPSIQHSLHFSQQNLQWVSSGYILTYGGFLLLGGRLGDLLGRRRMLLIGMVVFALASLAAGASQNSGEIVAARLVQGVGAALMSPAALSELTTSFREGKDRNTALGLWGATSGVAAAAGVALGGVLTAGPGWRWVFYINPPICILVAAGAVVLLRKESGQTGRNRSFDSQGAGLVTGGLLLLIYSLVRAPIIGWAKTETILTFVGAGVLLVAFVVNEARSQNPLLPFSILRVRGLVAADLTQLIAFAGFFSMFFYLTLYMQEILHFSALKTGLAFLPTAFTFGVAGGVASQLVTRIGSRVVVVAGCLIAAGGLYYLSRVPVHGSYPADLLPGLMVVALGIGAVFVSVAAAANAGVPPDKAGLAAGLLSSSQQMGSALGLAVLSAIATTHTNNLLAHGSSQLLASDRGDSFALIAGAIMMAVAGIIALRIANTHKGAPIVMVSEEATSELSDAEDPSRLGESSATP
jgi:EmrB/QacA subfamily drug resistance transporter